MTEADHSEVAAVRSKYEAAIAQNDPRREVMNRRLADADRRGDTKGIQAAIGESIVGPHPIYDLLKKVAVPGAVRSDLDAYVRADEEVKAADEAYVQAKIDSGVRAAAHQRNIALRANENTANQFRIDLGMPLTPCPYRGP